ncbi:signal transduction histidine kinase [Glaciihabitans tibetensis]|uniref:histidine kinase n=1 Tax=Glaciihabitans tibetensis TaxID=1266600 RepID=A0A2T0VAM0_9MICO|nr:HAMP domain-containing sensor histidine kinase [Glaciihabitans tibetensis]PRY67203.1 signal transduction histidine kinase [Glaciihabitans tibetensis]
MPLSELQPSRDGRRTVFARAQLPFLIMTLLLAIAVAVALPSDLLSIEFLTGVAIAVAASIVALTVPWERHSSQWLITIAVADLVAVAFLRFAVYPEIAGVGLLAIFPALWFAYGFHPAYAPIGVIGAFFVTLFPLVYTRELPTSALGWVNVLTLPVAVALIMLAVQTAATQMRLSRGRLIENSRKLAAALDESEDNGIIARTIFDTVDAAMTFYGVDNRLLIANQTALDMSNRLGFRLDDPPFADVDVLAADRTTPLPAEQQLVARALRGEEVTGHIEWLGPPGDQVAIMGSARQVHRVDGHLLGTVIAAYNITELANAIDVRERFLTTVSHELRTPLTSIMGYLEMIEDEVDAAALGVDGYFSIVRRNSVELLARISELLQFSDKAAPVVRSSDDIRGIVLAAVTNAMPAATAAGLTVEHRLADGPGALVDSRRFDQVIDNLLSNAIKYSPAGGTVVVELRHTSAETVLSVSDTGAGMTPDEQSQAFDPFYRSASARVGAIPGFGVGLSIVKEIVAAHGGDITVSSAPGEGTTMTVRVPRQVEP